MRTCTGAARQQIETSAGRGSLACSLGSNSDVFLTLPAVSAAVPVASASTKNAERWAQVALLSLELVDESEITVGKQFDPQKIAAQALSKWASKHCEGVKVLGSFSISVALSADDMGLSSSEKEDGTWAIGLCSEQTERYFTLKTRVEELEAKFPGLGHTAAHLAETASFKTFSLFSPTSAFWFSQYLYWYGLDDDESFLEERKANYDDGEEEDDTGELFKPSDFKSSFPDFFFSFSETVLPVDQLQSIADSGDQDAKEVASLLLSIKELVDAGAELPGLSGCDCEPAFFSGYLGWDEKDCLNRCLDDFYEMANQGSDYYSDFFGVTHVPFSKRKFTKWRGEMEKGFELYVKLDRLIQLIGTAR